MCILSMAHFSAQHVSLFLNWIKSILNPSLFLEAGNKDSVEREPSAFWDSLLIALRSRY